MLRDLCISCLLTFILASCVTGGTAEDNAAAVASDDEISGEVDPVRDAEVVGSRPNPPPKVPVGDHIPLGPITDEDIKKSLWQGLEKRLTSSQTVSDEAEEASEIGDFEAFKFTVVNTSQGSDDVSGEKDAIADGMLVEVSGWYKKTLTQSDAEPKSTCFSFDIAIPAVKRGSAWVIPEDHRLHMTREDQEDCY